MCVGRIATEQVVPHIEDWDNEVFYVANESGFKITLVVTWESLRAGLVPGMQR